MKRLWPVPVFLLLLAAPLRAQEDDEADVPAQEETLAPPEGESAEHGDGEEPQPQGGAAANADPSEGEDGEPAEMPVKEKEEPLISVKAASSEPEEYDEAESVEVAAPKKKVVPTATIKAPVKGKPAATAPRGRPVGKMAPPPVKKKAPVVAAAAPPRPTAPAVPLTPITPRNP